MTLGETWPANPLRRAWTDRSALRETAGAASGFAGAGCTGAEAWVAAIPTREASYGVRRRHPALTPRLSPCCDGCATVCVLQPPTSNAVLFTDPVARRSGLAGHVFQSVIYR